MQTSKFIGTALVAFAALTLFPSAHATSIFFGEDTGLGDGNGRVAHPNSDTAANNFLSQLVGVGTETFESFATGTTPPFSSTFMGAGTATFTGIGQIANVPSGDNLAGRYPISGNQYFDTESDFTITFSTEIAAFGFYGVDIGDFGGQTTLTLTHLGGPSTMVTVPNIINGPGGGVLFFGFIDTDNPFTSVTFGDTAPGVDFFGFDDMTIGSIEQVNPTPDSGSTLSLLGLAMVGLAVLRYKPWMLSNRV
jgi:hypothetical protein